MYGAIAGDIIGSIYEAAPIKTTDFPLFGKGVRFTDDTVLTVAVAEALRTDGNYVRTLKKWGRKYPHAGYGGNFRMWLFSDSEKPYNSFGNGSAMRVSPVGWACNTFEEVLREAEKSAAVTHNHPEGIKGAQAVAVSVFLARNGAEKKDISAFLADKFGYDMDRTLSDIRIHYRFDVTCQGSVPEAVLSFIESDSPETAIRNAVSLGGDTDTQACMAGAIAEAFYGGLDTYILKQIKKVLSDRRDTDDSDGQHQLENYIDASPIIKEIELFSQSFNL